MRQPGQPRALLAASCFLCLVTTTAFAQRDNVVFARGETIVLQGQTLQLGIPVERQLSPNEAHSYSLTLEENTYVQIVVVQRGIDLIVQVGGPAGKNLGDRLTLAPLDQLVDVRRLPIEPLRQRPRHRRFAGGHEADQIDLVCLHEARRSSVSKNMGYEMPTASAPSMIDGCAAPSAAIANAMAIR